MFAVFALGGILISESFRQNVFDICKFFKVDADTVYILYSWGSYLVYLPYVLMIAVMEHYFNTAARTGQVWRRTLRVGLIEGSLGLASVLISLLFTFLQRRPG